MSDDDLRTDGKQAKSGRVPKTAWKPGQSGNPGGRPAITDAVREAMEALKKATPGAVARLVELMASDDERVAHAAAKTIVDKAVPDKLDGEAGAAAAAALVSLVVDLGAGRKPPGE